MVDMALSDVRVLDLTHHVAGPFATNRLAGFGADVIKIERPSTGDPARQIGPFLHDEPGLERSKTFFYLNTNKRGVTLNLKSPTGKAIFKELVRKADVVVESFRPHVMRDLGLSYSELKKINPKIVMASITTFGQTGPYAEYKATEMVYYGMAGSMYQAGEEDREPVSFGTPTAVYYGGLTAATGILGAIFKAMDPDDPVGQYVDISLMEEYLTSVDRRISTLLAYEYSGKDSQRESIRGGFATGYFPCQDGYFCMAASGNYMFPRMVKMMGDPEPLLDPRFLTPEGQRSAELRDLFEAVLIGWAMDHTKEEISQLAAANGLICAPVNTMADVARDRHFNARGVFVDVDHPVMGTVRTIGRPFIMKETPFQMRYPAPTLGQHNQEIYCDELGYSKTDLVRLHQAGVI
jgi:crotonobetainyl-CoA:carnitine CoA-transferase CaiB-like acyl-CoA transferase